MILHLIEEINKCLDIDCYLVALTSALSLPDICGKAEYPTLKPSDRYIKWYDEYIGKYEITEESKNEGVPYPSGLVVYNLRNSLMHEGNPNINEQTCDIQEFELLIEDKNRCSSYAGGASIRIDYFGDTIIKKTNAFRLGARLTMEVQSDTNE